MHVMPIRHNSVRSPPHPLRLSRRAGRGPGWGCLLAFLCSLFPIPCSLLAQPTVSNVTAAQRADQSRSGRASLPADFRRSHLAAFGPLHPGAIGPAISLGPGKAVVWDASADIPGRVGSFRAEE
jgi:hypothetical protein